METLLSLVFHKLYDKSLPATIRPVRGWKGAGRPWPRDFSTALHHTFCLYFPAEN